VLHLEILIVKFHTVDRLAARAIAFCEVAALDHELLDDAVEERPLVVQRLARLAQPLLACAEGAEVLCRLWDDVIVELEGDAPRGLVADRDVEEDPTAGGLSLALGIRHDEV
jgi:hypothetical protein